MAITVKKKKLTVKTIKAKKTPDGGPPPVDGEAAAPIEGAEPAAPEQVAAEVAAVAAPAAASVTKPASYTLAGIFAIITFLFFTSLIVLQYMEWTFFMDAFPKPNMAIQGTSYTPSSSTTPEAVPIDEITAPADTPDTPAE